MARKSDMTNIRKRKVRRNGKWETHYQTRVRLQDDRGELQTLTQTFDNYDDAKRWRDDMRSQVQQGELGNKLAQRKILRQITLKEMIQRYLQSPELHLQRSSKNQQITLRAFLKREENGLCRKSLAEITQQDFQQYADRRLYTGPDRVSPGTLRKDLNPIRTMWNLARSPKWNYPV
jgi:hypothetical protein